MSIIRYDKTWAAAYAASRCPLKKNNYPKVAAAAAVVVAQAVYF